MRIAAAVALLTLVAAPTRSAAQDESKKAPSGWRWHLDDSPQDTTLQIWQMAPGWHATTQHAGFWWDTTMVARGKFAVEAEFHIFPESAASEWGLAIGVNKLGIPGESYLKFVIRRDGFYNVAIRERGNFHEIAPWKHTYYVNQPVGEGSAKNLVRIQAHGSAVAFYLNGQRVFWVDRSMTRIDGQAALRIGAGINAHITTLKIEPLDS